MKSKGRKKKRNPMAKLMGPRGAKTAAKKGARMKPNAKKGGMYGGRRIT